MGARPAPLARPQERPTRPRHALLADGGVRGHGPHRDPARLHLHHPAEPRHGPAARPPAAARTERAARPQTADRLLLPLAGPRPARTGGVRRAVRDRQRRHPGRTGGQGRRWPGHRPEPRVERARRHAGQRHRHRHRRRRTGAGCDAGPDPVLCPPRLRRQPAAGASAVGVGPGRAQEGLRGAAQPHRPRLFALQGEHDRPSGAAPHGTAPG